MTLQFLSGVRVLELSLIIHGNQTGGLLADLGADVVKIEPPPFGDYIREVYPVDLSRRASAMDMFLNRNKRSVTLDLKNQEGREVFYRLVETADIIFDLSLPGTRERLKVDYETCKKIKPDIIYCALTGFGYTGPYAKIPAHGYGPMAMAGEVPIESIGNGRYTMGQPSGGTGNGPVYAALGMLAALAHRDRTGEGGFIETSLVDAAVHVSQLSVYQHFNPDHQAKPPNVGSGTARYNVYECSDGKFIMFAPIEYKFWKRFCEQVGRQDWLERGAWEGVVMDFGRNDDQLSGELADFFRTRTQQEWVEFIGRGAAVPATPANTFTDLLEDEEYVNARQMTVSYHDPRLDDEITLASFPVKRPGVPFRIERPAPNPGEHNAEVLGAAGYDAAAIERLYASGALYHAASPGKGA